MNIYFVGQPSVLGPNARDGRVRALAGVFGVKGHMATAFSAVEHNIRSAGAFRMRYLPSLSPQNPGGFLYSLLSLFAMPYGGTNVIHFMSWKAAALAPIAAMMHPQATFVWTIDSMPPNHSFLQRIVVWVAARIMDAITVPTRQLQYQFRLRFNVLPIYIPDGYIRPKVADIPARTWRLKKHAYTLVVGNDSNALRDACLAYKTTGSRKKLIVLVPAMNAALSRMEKRYSFVRFIVSNTPRERASIIRQAEKIVFADDSVTSQEFLLAMDSGRPVIASNIPLFQELAGTTVQFFRAGDRQHMSHLLKTITATKQAQKRARAHFSWERIFEEYETLYHYPLVRRVPVDSVRPATQIQSTVY